MNRITSWLTWTIILGQTLTYAGPLHAAAAKGDFNDVQTLNTALCWAADSGHLRIKDEQVIKTFPTPLIPDGNSELHDELFELLRNEHYPDDGSRPPFPRGLFEFPALAVVGYRHAVMLIDGEAWAWGVNSEGQLGIGNDKPRLIPKKILLSRPISQVAVGYEHTLLLTREGRVFSFGRPLNGQLGHGAPTVSHFLPKQVQIDGRVVQILANKNQSWALTKDGRVWEWGEAAWSEERSTLVRTWREPKHIPIQAQIVQIGFREKGGIVLALDVHGALWAWNEKILIKNKGLLEAQLIENHLSIARMASSGETTLLATKDGKLWKISKIVFNEVGQFAKIVIVKEPVDYPYPVAEVALWGNNYLILAKNGEVWQLDDRTIRRVPIKEPVVQIGMGDLRALAISDKGEVWTWAHRALYRSSSYHVLEERAVEPKPIKLTGAPPNKFKGRFKFDIDIEVDSAGFVHAISGSRSKL